MILADFLPATPDRSWQLARQLGVTHAICKCAPELTGLPAPDNLAALRTIRVMALSDSPSHGITYCQATFRAMGEDIVAAARRFASRIVFVHFRDIAGAREDFTETFHDNGPTDMPAMIKLYADLGFTGPIRVDHVPSMAGEKNLPHGYAQLGHLFALGYLKGILDTHRIPYD
jgi:D-mannonate dehydratase